MERNNKPIMVYLLVLVMTTFLVVVSVIFLSRFYEQPLVNGQRVFLKSGEYRLVLDKTVDGVKDNLSGLTWSPDHGALFAVVNNPPEILQLSKAGEVQNRFPVHEIEDPETLEYFRDNIFYVASERKGIVYSVEIKPEHLSVNILSASEQIFRDAGHNHGLEGLALDRNNDTLYLAREKKPVQILVKKSGESSSTVFAEKENLPQIEDISGLAWVSRTESLLVLSDESSVVYEIGRDRKIKASLTLKKGVYGIKDTVPQAEGIAVDNQEDIYILSEPNLFYRFTRTPLT